MKFSFFIYLIRLGNYFSENCKLWIDLVHAPFLFLGVAFGSTCSSLFCSPLTGTGHEGNSPNWRETETESEARGSICVGNEKGACSLIHLLGDACCHVLQCGSLHCSSSTLKIWIWTLPLPFLICSCSFFHAFSTNTETKTSTSLCDFLPCLLLFFSHAFSPTPNQKRQLLSVIFFPMLFFPTPTIPFPCSIGFTLMGLWQLLPLPVVWVISHFWPPLLTK